MPKPSFETFDGTEPEKLDSKGKEALALSYFIAGITRDMLGAALFVEAIQTFWTTRALNGSDAALDDCQKLIGEIIQGLFIIGRKEFADQIAKAALAKQSTESLLAALLKPEGKA